MEDIGKIKEIEKEIDSIFTRMTDETRTETDSIHETSENFKKSSEMISQLTDFIDKYGVDTLQESDALASAVSAESDYISTLKSRILEAENENDTLQMAYSHLDVDPDTEDINKEIECKTSLMKYLLHKFQSQEYSVEDISSEFKTFYNGIDGTPVVQCDAIFLVQRLNASMKDSSDNYLYVLKIHSSTQSSSAFAEIAKALKTSMRKMYECMHSKEKIGSLPLVPFLTKLAIMNTRELSKLVKSQEQIKMVVTDDYWSAEEVLANNFLVLKQEEDDKEGQEDDFQSDLMLYSVMEPGT